MDWGREEKANYTSLDLSGALHLNKFKQFEAFTLNPLMRDNISRYRVTIGHLRPVVVTVVPVLADSPFSGTEGHNAG
jgi:hypothetical protein